MTDSIEQCITGIMGFYKIPYVFVFTPGLSRASSRLDMWYVSDIARLWASATELDTYGLSGDHKGVILHLRNPDDAVRLKQEPRVFPVQPYATEHVDKYVRCELAAFELSCKE